MSEQHASHVDPAILEELRRKTLLDLAILDTPPEAEFDDLTEIAARALGAPMAGISFVDEDRVWLKSARGLGVQAMPRERSFCERAVQAGTGLYVVPDATEHALFRTYPMVTGPLQVRFFAGVPLSARNGVTLGTLFVLDRQPRRLNENQEELLRTLARQASRALDDRRRQRELETERQARQRAVVEKSEFLATTGQELRTPLNTILGMVDLLEDSDLSREQRQNVRILSSSAQVLFDLIHGILDLSRVESGRLALHSEPFSLRPTMETVLESLGAAAHRKGMAITLDIGRNVPSAVVGDPARLRQVLTNLLASAIKASDSRCAGGVSLRVRTSSASAGHSKLVFGVEHTLSESASQAPAHSCSLEPRAPLEALPNAAQGLRVELAQRLLERMGSHLAVRGDVRRGGVFQFELALPTHRAQDSVALPAWEHPPRVLLADDNASERDMVRRLLEEYGCSVVAVKSGEEALEHYLREQVSEVPFDVVLLDARMPGLPGFETAERLRDAPGALSRVIMMLAADHRRADIQRCDALALGGRVIKPVRASTLRETIEQVLQADVPLAVLGSLPVSRQEERLPRGLRVLVAAEPEEDRFLICQLLKELNCAFDFARDAGECLAKVAQEPFDLVLLDVELPAPDALETPRALRQLESEMGRAPAPIFAMAMDSQLEERARLLESGCNELLPRPLRRQALLETIRNHVHRPQAEQAQSDSTPAERDAATELVGELRAMVPSYLDQRRDDLQSLWSAIERLDWTTIRRLGREMRESGPSFGLRDIEEIGRALEDAASHLDGVDVRARAGLLESTLQRLAETLR